jgi:allantoicase
MNERLKEMMDVASDELGTEVIYTTDEFFARANKMLQSNEAVFLDEYDDNGHWMDGWETRRRRDDKNDYCIIKLGLVSQIHNFQIDTTHFKGNYPPAISIMGCYAPDVEDEEIIKNPDKFQWNTLLRQSDLVGDKKQDFFSSYSEDVTHLKVDIYPDGGIARLRAYGYISFDKRLYAEENTNVISRRSGARAIYTNNEFFGDLKNIIKVTEAKNMGDGWETRRRREPGFDWGIIELGNPAIIDNIMIDTNFFKGNYPDSFSICSAYMPNTTHSSLVTQSIYWEELISSQKLQMDSKHYYDKSYLLHTKPITHIRLNIFPDGGISRLKLFGKFIEEFK